MAEAAPGLHAVNWAVIVLYLLGMIALGGYMSRRIKGSRGFFIAEGRLGPVVVGLSLLGTYLSALTMMALPGKSFGPEDWLWTIQLPFLIITAVVITRFVLPRYRDAGVISVYEFLEQRIHLFARLLASFCFLLLSIGRMGLVLYLPALAFSRITGTSIEGTIIVMGLIVTLYTVLGGIEAVIWTDAVQVVILAVGALLSVGYILYDVNTVGADFIGLAAAHHKFRMIEPSLDYTQLVSLWLILETIFQTIRIYGTQQDMTQRFMATKSTREANRSVWISILGYIPLAYLFYFIGSALFIYYTASPDALVLAELAKAKPKFDAMYPHFIVTRLPLGVGGVVLAAIFAAAMSSIDSSMNSSSTVCVEDFYRRLWRKDESDRHYLAVARILTLMWGVLAVAMALAFRHVQYAQDTWSKVMSFSTTGVLALMILAFLPVRIRPAAAIAGWATAAASVAVMSLGTRIHFLLYPVIGNTLGFAVALLWNAAGLWLKAMYRMCPEEVFPLEQTQQAGETTEVHGQSREGEPPAG
jgi:SSS family solute:Na+ symporter